jgi:hypothetical protein
MVGGLEKFQEFFEGYKASYIIIGGTACERQLSQLDRSFRRTDDVDIVLITEALTPEFVARFWEFIEEGEYDVQEEEVEKRQFYRFQRPAATGFPIQLELFSRRPDVITLKENMRFTPIPVDEGLTSLSAILMDENYYNFIIENSDLIDGLNIASTGALITLKAKAYLDLTERKEQGEKIDSKKIFKHRIDIIRLLAIVPGNYTVNVPDDIKADLARYITLIEAQKPDFTSLLKELGLAGTAIAEFSTQIRTIFNLPAEG